VSAPCTLFGPCNCASCRATVPDTPLPVANQPGLAALKYRVGTFSTFRQAMLDYISLNPVSNPSPADASQTFTLTSRSSDDYGVAMLELWAYVCDVLTFYQQSIANEAYLRTATQQASVARLAALLGYRPAPPVAASVFLAFLASKGATAAIPVGLQTQSAPGPGQKPVIYEVTNAASASALNNQPALMGPQVALSLDRSAVLIQDDPASPLAQGNRLLFFDVTTPFVSEQQVVSVVPQPVGKLVTWRGLLGGLNPASASLHTFRLGRTFRCFGASAPATFLTVTVNSSNQPSWTVSSTTPTTLAAGVPTSAPLWLDSVYTGLGVGSPMLIECDDGSGVHLLYGTIHAVANGSQTVGPVTGNTTGVTLSLISGSLPSGALLANISIYELLGPGLTFAATGFDPTVSPRYAAGAQTIYVLDASGMVDGTQIALTSSGADGVFGDIATVSGTPSPITQATLANPVTLGYSVQLLHALTNSYDISTTLFYANVAAATQGKTQPKETLGSGDASQEWQEFALKSSPVTYVANAAAESGAASTLQVFVNNIEWTEVDTFYARGPNDQVFVTRVGDNGTTYVRFGDGVTGQRPATGNGNVTALYRAGAGSNGDVDANDVSILLQSVQGLQSVTNPLPAVGGGDGQAIDQTRENAPISVLTLGRAVSLRDYEALALTYLDGSITKARASWVDLNDRRGVSLTAAAVGGLPLGQLAQPLRDFLDQHRDPNVPLAITGVTEVFFVFRAIVHVQDGYLQSAAMAAAEAALGLTCDAGYLSYAQLQIGESIYQSRLLSALQDAAGVEWIELKEFSTAYSSGRIGFSPLGNYGPPPFPPGPPGPGHKRLEAMYINPQQIAQPSLTGSVGDISVDMTYAGGVNDLQ